MKNTVAICIVLLMLSVCHAQEKHYTYSDFIYNQVEFAEITFSLEKKTGDTLRIEGLLNAKAIINEIPCKGKIMLTKEGRIKKFNLAEAHNFAGNTFPPGTYIVMDIDLDCRSDVNSLRYYTTIRGALNQVINLCIFPSTQTIYGISCNGEEGVFFRTDWSLLGCILAENDTIKENVLPKGTFIRFDNEGRIGCFCLTDTEIQGYLCSGTDYTHWAYSGGGGIYLYRSGRLKYFQPVDDIEIQGVWCKPSSVRGEISLYENGKLKECTSARDQTIDGVFCEENFTLKFDDNGNITYAKKEKIFD